MSNTSSVPVLDDNDFEVWKDRISKYMDSIDERLMTVVLNGPMFPLKVNTTSRLVPPLADVEGAEPEVKLDETLVRKPRNEWTEEDKITYGLDNRAKYILTCGINNKTYKHIFRCKTAQEIWIAILQYYEGDQITKDNKLYSAIQEFEAFRKEPNECLKDAYDRFCEVCNTCAALGKEYSMKDLNMRFLSSLGNGWHVKITAIKEARDLNTTHIQNLVSSLFLYEKELLKLQVSDKQLKQIALPAQIQPSATTSDSIDLQMQQLHIQAQEPTESTSASETQEDAFAAFARNYLKNKFTKRQQPRTHKYPPTSSPSYQKPFTKPSDGKNAQGELVCYNCRRPGHFASKCPKPKFEYLRKKAPKYFQKNKGLIAEEKAEEPLIWLESDSDDEGAENADFVEEADVSFMALDNEYDTEPINLPIPSYISPMSSSQVTRTEVSNYASSVYSSTDDFEDPIPDVENPHGYMVHRYSGGLYGQVGPSQSSSKITRSNDPITPIKSPSKSPTYTPTKYTPSTPIKNPLLPFSQTESCPSEAYHTPAGSQKSASSYSQNTSNDEFSREDMAHIMNEMFNDFEELKEVHNVLSDNFKSATTENQTLKAEIIVLRCLQEEVTKLKSENASLSLKLKTCIAQIGDVVARNNSLTATVNKFTKSKNAVEMLLATQEISHGKDGIGYDQKATEEKESVSKSICKPSVANAIPHTYPNTKKQIQESNKGKKKLKNDELKPAERDKDYSSAETTSTDSSSSSDSDKIKISPPKSNRKTVQKGRVIKFVPAGFCQEPSDSFNEVNNTVTQIAPKLCQICNESSHMTYDCLLRTISGAKGVKPSNGSQIWLPKRN